MWYFVEKNGKAIKPYKSQAKALEYAKRKVKFDPVADVLRVVSQSGDVLLEW